MTDLARLQTAMEQLPPEHTTAYRKALNECPELIDKESAPEWFVHREQGDYFAAAARLAAYWQARQEIFGSLAPLTSIACNYLHRLPHDQHGRDVYYYCQAASPRPWAAHKRSVLHVLFWLAYQATCHKKSVSQQGVVGLCLLNVDSERQSAKPMLDLIEEVLPVRLTELHLCWVAPPMAVDAVLPAIRLQFRRLPHIHLSTHTGTMAEIGAELRAAGLLQVPVEIGGTWRRPSPTVSGLNLLSSISSSLPPHYEDAGFVESPSMQREGLRRLQEAMELLREEERAAYQAALLQVPHLVELETNPLRYLRYSRYDAWAAARRLAYAWHTRVKVFGLRAFLPLSMTGDGALDEGACNLMRSGYFTFLPKDDQGRTVLCYHPDRRIMDYHSSRMQAAYYVWHVMCENDVSLEEGWVGFGILGRSTSGGSRMDGFISNALEIVNNSFPTTIHRLHLVNCPTGLGQRVFFDFLLPIAVKLMSILVNDNTTVSVGTPDELVEKLAQYGFARENLPDSIGGTWSVTERHQQWCQERIQLEVERYGLRPRLPLVAPAALPAVALSSVAAAAAPVVPMVARSGPAPVLDDQVLERGCVEVAKILEAMPAEAKTSYAEALRRCPRVVDKESNPKAFLRFDRDPQKAARRILAFWKVRCLIFGARAFMPLDQTGDGALDRKDLAVLGTTYLMLLPNDDMGRSVLFCDGSRLSGSSRESRLRTMFYLYAVASENQQSQTQGVVLLYVMTEPSFDRAHRECLDLVLSALPLGLCDVHLLRYPEDQESDDYLDKLDPASLHQFRQTARGQVVTHPVESLSAIVDRLSTHGLRRDGLPKSLGGRFGFDKFVQWQELRVRYEWDLPAGPSNRDQSDLYDFSRAKPLHLMTEEEKNDRKRKLNVIHSRRKRERERMEVEGLNEQVGEYREQQKELKKKTERLEGLVQQANALVASYGGS